MWAVFYMLYEAFQRDAFDYFAGMVSYPFSDLEYMYISFGDMVAYSLRSRQPKLLV